MGKKWYSLGVMIILTLCTHVAASEESPVHILFDQGHNQRFLIEEKGPLQLSSLAGIMRGQGANVKSTRSPLSEDTLKGFSALVISGPFEALLPEEVDAVASFIKRGGRLAVMLHIGPPFAGLLERLDVDYSNSVLHERRNVIDTDINFSVKDLAADPLFSGISQFSVYGAWALAPGAAVRSIANTSSAAWVDLNGDKILSQGDAIGIFSVVVSGTSGAGGFIIFGDDAIFQNRYLDDDNRKLADNLSLWLAGR